MEWFRMYSEFASDPKVQSMSEAMQRRLMMLLCLRCSNTLVTLQDDEIAFALRITDEELADTKVLFMRKNFINDTWEIMQWDKRQFVSDSSAARVAKHRAAKKQGGEQTSNVTVTPQNRADTEQIQNRTDTETTPPQAAKPSATKKSKTALPNGFALSDRVIAWADEKGHGNLQAHLENFISAAKRNGYVYADWDEALMEAIRKDWAKLSQAKGLPTDLDSINARNNAEAKRLLFGTPSDLRTINA